MPYLLLSPNFGCASASRRAGLSWILIQRSNARWCKATIFRPFCVKNNVSALHYIYSFPFITPYPKSIFHIFKYGKFESSPFLLVTFTTRQLFKWSITGQNTLLANRNATNILGARLNLKIIPIVESWNGIKRSPEHEVLKKVGWRMIQRTIQDFLVNR